MIEGRVSEVEGEHKDLCLEPTKLLVSDDVQEVLSNIGYWNLLEVFDRFDVVVSHQVENGWVEGCIIQVTLCFKFFQWYQLRYLIQQMKV